MKNGRCEEIKTDLMLGLLDTYHTVFSNRDMREYEKLPATIKLMNKLAKGRRSGEEEGWLTIEEVERGLGPTQ